MSDNIASSQKEPIVLSTKVSGDDELNGFEEGEFDTPVKTSEGNSAVENLNKMMEESFKGLGEEPIIPSSPIGKDCHIPEITDSHSRVTENDASKTTLGTDTVVEKSASETATNKVSLNEKENVNKKEGIPSEIAASKESDSTTDQASTNSHEIQSEISSLVNQVPKSDFSDSTSAKTSLEEVTPQKNHDSQKEIDKESKATEVKKSSELIEKNDIETKGHVESETHDVKQGVESKSAEKKSDSNQDMFDMTEEEALAFLKEEEDAKKAQAAMGPPKIEIYGSSVSGNMKIKKAQNVMTNTLERFKIEYDFVDLAADEQARNYIKRKNPSSTNIPQLYINGEFKMEFAEFEELLEYDELFEALGVEPDF